MPELPEVETVRRGLVTRIVKKKVASVSFDWPKGFPNSPLDVEGFLIGSVVTNVSRRAKVLSIDLDTGYTLVIHLKMTGQLVFRSPNDNFGAGHPNGSLVGDLPDKSTRVVIKFSDNSTLYFNDQRKFGWIRLLPTTEVPKLDFFKKLGPEPLPNNFTSSIFASRLERRKNSNIKSVLLDQTVVAGVGNIYADESLWGAKINPSTLVRNLSKPKMNNLFTQLRYVLNLAIEKGGSTNKNYVNIDGKRGSYMDFARVFRREGLACPRCQTTIQKTRVAGRGTHLCPNCQRLVK